MANLPQGTITFLFTDIEGSTKLAHRFGTSWAEILGTHRRILRATFGGGVEISTEGDSFFVAFDDAIAAIRAAAAGQRALAEHVWPTDGTIRVRMGLHTGHASVDDGSYVGIEVHRAARIAAAGHGGQVLLSESTHALASRQLPSSLTIRELGPHRLKDLSSPEPLFQLIIPSVPTDFPALSTLDDPRTNLPTQLTSFVGREREVSELRALAEIHRIVTVTGAGGTGKTRLALEAVGRMIEPNPDGAWLVELAPIADPDRISGEVARALRVQDEAGRSITETLLDFVRRKRLLLVLDNCEHLIGPVADLVALLLRDAPSLTVVATSREALGTSGEAVYPVRSMTVPPSTLTVRDDHEAEADWISRIAEAEAVRLFVDRAKAVDPSFELTGANAGPTGDICRRLDGIPLAIELAAARVNLLAVHDIADRLGDRFRLLTGGSRSALPRQQTLQALIDWSWDLLEEPDRQLLRRLSVFAGGATLEAATGVTAIGPEGAPPASDLDVLDGIGRLVARSLVVAGRESPTRYRLLETIRQYASARLEAAGEVSALRDAHLRSYLELAELADGKIRGPMMTAWVHRLDADVENLRNALDWAFETDAKSALRLCLALTMYWRTHGMLEGFERLRRAVDLIDGLTESDPGAGSGGDGLRARVLAAAANLAWLTGNASVGLPWAERAVKMTEDTDDPTARYEALDTLAMTRVFTGSSEGVMSMTAEAMRLGEAAGDWFIVAFTEAGLAQGDAESGDLEAAEQRLERAMGAGARSGNPSVMAFVALSQGRVAGYSGRLDEARGAFDRAISGYADMDDARLLLVARSDYAHALRLSGEIAEAEPMYRQTLHAWLHAGNRGAIANQLESFALIALARDQRPRAARLFGAAEAIRESASAPMLPFERPDYESAVETLHGGGDRSGVDDEWAEGRRLTVEDAAAFALGSDD